MADYTLITGASEGLGREFARLAARAGHNLILTARSGDKLQALADELRKAHPDVADIVVLTADLTDMDQTQTLWSDATSDRRITVLVNNAGLGRNGRFADDDFGGWARELASVQVNVVAATYLLKEAVQHMTAGDGGRILNVASVAGFMPGPNMAVYHATKAYMLSLSEAVAEEQRGTSVRVTTLCPGPTETSFFDAGDMRDARVLKLSQPMSAREVAQAGWVAAKIGQPVVVPGILNKVLAILPRIAPRFVVTRIAAFVMGRA